MATYTPQQIAAEWARLAPRQLQGWATPMARIAMRESGGNAKIDNSHTGPGGGKLNKNGTVDWTLYGVNDIWRKDPVVGKLFRSGELMTLTGATKAAIRIMQVQGPGAWSSSGAVPQIGTPITAGAAPTTNATVKATSPGGFHTNIDAAIMDALATHHGSLGHAAMANIMSGRYDTYSAPAARAAKVAAGAGADAAHPVTAPNPSGANGSFTIFGANPGRLTKPLVAFAREVAGVYGSPLRGDSGATHSKFTVDGNVSDHWAGNATDIPATGHTLLMMGRAALIAAGMPRAQASKAMGGLYNIGGHQVIFLTNQGGNHFNHLHISV